MHIGWLVSDSIQSSITKDQVEVSGWPPISHPLPPPSPPLPPKPGSVPCNSSECDCMIVCFKSLNKDSRKIIIASFGEFQIVLFTTH